MQKLGDHLRRQSIRWYAKIRIDFGFVHHPPSSRFRTFTLKRPPLCIGKNRFLPS